MNEEQPVYGYTPPTTSVSNQNQSDLLALVQQLQAQVAVLTPTPPKVLTAEEAARAAIDNAGKGLGVDERLAELYRHLDTIARKVGI